MMHLRQLLAIPAGRPLRVLIHARFSTEEQRQSSIDDQVAACRHFIDANLPKGTKPNQVAVDVITEPEVSGEIADRPGINQVWAGIEAKRWDVIIAEESSRLYRHHTKAGELFESAVDAGVRVTLNSDDPPFFHTTLGTEYAKAGLDAAVLRGLTRTAIEASFADAALKARLLGEIDR